jgi:hypothetical protein
MKLEADTDVIKFFLRKIENIYNEELAENPNGIIERIWFHAWKTAEEYHRERIKKGLSSEQDAVNRNLRLP